MQADLAILGPVVQVIGFIALCRIGARFSDWLQRKSRWLPIIVGSVVIAGCILLCYLAGRPLNFIEETVGFFGVAFGGGIVARQQNLIVNNSSQSGGV